MGRNLVTHQFASVVYCISGRIVVEYGSHWCLQPGEAIIVLPGEPHRWLIAEQACWWQLAAPATHPTTTKWAEPFARVREGLAPICAVPAERRSFLDSLFGGLSEISVDRSTAHDRGDYDAMIRWSFANLILHELQGGQSACTRTEALPQVARDALQYIERNCLRRVSLSDVATAVGCNGSYVTTTLARSTGRTVKGWIVAGRMAEARRLLQSSNERVDAIGERVGYCDTTHFIRVFRREHGMTPANWRSTRSKR